MLCYAVAFLKTTSFARFECCLTDRSRGNSSLYPSYLGGGAHIFLRPEDLFATPSQKQQRKLDDDANMATVGSSTKKEGRQGEYKHKERDCSKAQGYSAEMDLARLLSHSPAGPAQEIRKSKLECDFSCCASSSFFRSFFSPPHLRTGSSPEYVEIPTIGGLTVVCLGRWPQG